MKSSQRTDARALSFLVGACYLISLTLCGVAAHSFVRLTLAAAGRVAHGIYPPSGLF